MTTRLILARHGNTIAPGDAPIWVGARTDMALVEKGLEQANILANALHQAKIVPAALITGPLQRTKRTAEIIAAKLNLAPSSLRIDPRLTEIDYGIWEGKTSEEIAAMGGEAELTAWNKDWIFPTSPGWTPSAEQIAANVAAILAETVTGTSILVTSNGILRFFAAQAANVSEFPQRKVATGHIGVMERGNEGTWRIAQWNQPPGMIRS